MNLTKELFSYDISCFSVAVIKKNPVTKRNLRKRVYFSSWSHRDEPIMVEQKYGNKQWMWRQEKETTSPHPQIQAQNSESELKEAGGT